MGGAASVPSEEINEEACRTFLGDKFDLDAFDKVRGESEFVTKEQLLHEIERKATDEEVNEVFTLFCPKGEMNGTVFKKFCSDCKLLSKKSKFEALDADMFFKDNLSKNSMGNSTGYSGFRLIFLPALAKKKNLELDTLLSKIAHCPGPSLTKKAKPVITVEDGELNEGENKEEDEKPFNIDEMLEILDLAGRKYNEMEHVSAQLIQNKHRSKMAKEKTSVLLDAMTAGIGSVKKEGFVLVADDACNKAFLLFSNKNEQIDCMSYIHFQRDAGLIDKKYTQCQADLVFERAKLLAHSSIEHSKGVFYGKRVGYDIFHSLIVPMIADKKAMTPEQVMEMFGAVTTKSQNDATVSKMKNTFGARTVS